VKTNNCQIFRADWEQKGSQLIFSVSADRFLRNMVRSLVGTLLDVGNSKIDLDGFRAIIESKNRNKAGLSVPAHGLILTDIRYPPKLFQRTVPLT
jgi:tRNA pseudouridine38-40 synthase